MHEQSRKLRFDRFLIDRGRRELRSGEQPIHLSPKAFLLLELLIKAAPDAVSRDELYQGLWPDTFVDEANLPNLIKELRKALGEDSRNPRFIKTLHGFGYAFNEIPEPEDQASVHWSPFVLQWAGRDFPLRVGRNVIGRDASADIQLDSPGVSRQHAAITVQGIEATIEDLGSKNGTYLDDASVDRATPVSDKHSLRLGSVSAKLRRIAIGDSTMTVGPEGTPDDS